MSAELMIRFIGSLAGAALALVFIPPKSWGGFFRRLAAALLCGVIFAGRARAVGGWDTDFEGTVSAACLTAFVSWGAMGTVTRIVKAWKAEETEGR